MCGKDGGRSSGWALELDEAEFQDITRLDKWRAQVAGWEEFSTKKQWHLALAGWLSCLEHHPINQKDTGLIPIQDTYRALRLDPRLGHIWQATN